MRSARLRQLVSLQRYQLTQDSYGQKIESWATYATVWAGVEQGSNAGAWKEYFAAQQNLNEQHALILMRFRDDVKVDDRVLYGSSVYQIKALIDPEQRHRELQIMGKLIL
jgi:SPP1 family predicted phage head-tail adaptor